MKFMRESSFKIISFVSSLPDDFQFGRLIGDGSFSSVFLAREVSTGRELAIKVCNKSHILREKKEEYILSEKAILVKISSEWEERRPFFVKLYSTFHVRRRAERDLFLSGIAQ